MYSLAQGQGALICKDTGTKTRWRHGRYKFHMEVICCPYDIQGTRRLGCWGLGDGEGDKGDRLCIPGEGDVPCITSRLSYW